MLLFFGDHVPRKALQWEIDSWKKCAFRRRRIVIFVYGWLVVVAFFWYHFRAIRCRRLSRSRKNIKPKHHFFKFLTHLCGRLLAQVFFWNWSFLVFNFHADLCGGNSTFLKYWCTSAAVCLLFLFFVLWVTFGEQLSCTPLRRFAYFCFWHTFYLFLC